MRLLVALFMPLLAACEGDMGVKRIIPPQWGSSITQTSGGASVASAQKQLVRVRLDRPQDITLYMEGALLNDQGTYLGPQIAAYSVTIGSGGVALEQGNLFVPAVGSARHFVTDAVDVNVTLGQVNLGAGGTRRVSAAVALGRPHLSYRTADMVAQTVAPGSFLLPAGAWTTPPVAWGWTGVGNGVFSWFRVPSYAIRVKMELAELAGGAAAADFEVRELDWSAGFYSAPLPSPTPTGPSPARTVADFLGDWQFIAPQATYLRLRCNVVGGSGRVLMTFERLQ